MHAKGLLLEELEIYFARDFSKAMPHFLWKKYERKPYLKLK